MSQRTTPATLVGLAFPILAVLLAWVWIAAQPASAASGDLSWRRVFNGTGNDDDRFFVSAPAPKGGVYAAGWTTAATRDLVLVRYTAGGRGLWVRTFDGTAHDADSATGLAVDGRGDAIVVGIANGAAGIAVVAKYAPGGRRLWLRTYDDPLTDADAAWAVTTDRAGNVYVAGTSRTGVITTAIVIKYSASGVRKWVRRFARTGGDGSDETTAIVTDGSRHLYITGNSLGAASQNDVLTLKYDTEGHRLWARTWDGGANGADIGFAVAANASGAYVAGQSETTTTGADGVLLRYGVGGRLLWHRTVAGPGTGTDELDDVALARNGDPVVAGMIDVSMSNGTDAAVERLSPAGKVRWTRTYNGPDSRNDAAQRVTVARSGSIYVVGTSEGTNTATDVLTLKYGAGGGLRWARRYTSTGGGSSDAGTALTVTAGSVYVTGYQLGLTLDGVLLRYKP